MHHELLHPLTYGNEAAIRLPLGSMEAAGPKCRKKVLLRGDRICLERGCAASHSLVALHHGDLRRVEWTDAPPNGDAADFREDDRSLQALLESAQPYEALPPVDLAALLDDVRAFIQHYVVLSAAQADAVALWALHTWTLDAAETTPYLSVTSAEKRSGKTRLLEALSLLVARPWLTSRVTAAVLVRKVAGETPTLLLDESDAAFKGEKEYAEALRTVLNAGYRVGGVASMCVKTGADFELRDFAVFCPKAVAGIGKLPDTVADRAIPIILKRRAPNEPVARFRWREAREAAVPIREGLERWASASLNVLVEARPDVPPELDDRAADGWEPLLAIADTAGVDWPERARRAAQSLSAGAGREDDSLGVRLLQDIEALFEERNATRLTSGDLVEALTGMEEAPWGDLRGRPLDARALARLLRPYDVVPHKMRLGEATSRGYESSDFADAWQRYIPRTSGTSGTGGTDTADKCSSDSSDVPHVPDVPLPKRIEPSPGGSDSENGLKAADGSLIRYAVQELGLPIIERGKDGRRRP